MDTSKETIEKALQIRYVRLKFTIQMTEDTKWPEYKSSALRGGIGEMLLRENCIRDRDCGNCEFASECIVQRTMYSRYEIQPDFVSSGDSIGYIIQCESKQKEYAEGETLIFILTLYGKKIVYFHQYLNAIYALGINGVGRENARFQIISVRNAYGDEILSGNNIMMKNYKIQTVNDYVRARLRKLSDHGEVFKMRFAYPLSIKYRGELVDSFQEEAFTAALLRRIYMMDCFEGIDADLRKWKTDPLFKILYQECNQKHIPRFSNRKQERITFHGIVGEVVAEITDRNSLMLLLAGEMLHIGKNTSFGYGRYKLE